MQPSVDLVIVFKASSKTLSKQQAIEDAKKAEQQYTRLLDSLKYPGLSAVGRRGENQGQLLVLVSCPQNVLTNLVQRERSSDFLSGLPTTTVPNAASVFDSAHLSSADRIRLVHTYIMSLPVDGGLGIIPGSTDWNLVESVMALHDREFNENWLRSWTTNQKQSVRLQNIREHFGDAIALYFAFLSSYTRSLIIPSVIGAAFWLLNNPYSILYSTLLLLWSTTFVEWWSVHERMLSLRWGTRGSFRVEKRRAEYTPGFPWWKRELRMIASVPVILLFATVLAALLTGIFVFEAFVTQLYTGPGHKYISFGPTILFIAIIPRVLAVYQMSAKQFTAWENHEHRSSHANSLTLKTFAMSAVVAYLGLALSAFVYVPFGEGVMHVVQNFLFHDAQVQNLEADFIKGDFTANGTAINGTVGIWEIDMGSAKKKLNPGRLQDQMFAYTVTNQVIGTFLEIGLPAIIKAIHSFRNGSSAASIKNKVTTLGTSSPKKRVVFEDEGPNGEVGKEEREFLERVRNEVALPEYELFGDYSEMVTQFGYVALWSTIWPLAPAMALLNNFLELRSDAFKITAYNRRPIPLRTDTIGPWLDALSFLTWLAALTNSALVYMFHPQNASPITPLGADAMRADAGSTLDSFIGPTSGRKGVVLSALLIALAASHGYFIMRAIVRHLVERIVWTGSEEVIEKEAGEREVKEAFLKSLPKGESLVVQVDGDDEKMGHASLSSTFWERDEGVQEIRMMVKEA